MVMVEGDSWRSRRIRWVCVVVLVFPVCKAVAGPIAGSPQPEAGGLLRADFVLKGGTLIDGTGARPASGRRRDG